MRKTLTRHGNSLALIIEKPVLDLLKIEAETTLDISTDGNSLVITPVRENDEAFDKAVEKVNCRYGKNLKRLAK